MASFKNWTWALSITEPSDEGMWEFSGYSMAKEQLRHNLTVLSAISQWLTLIVLLQMYKFKYKLRSAFHVMKTEWMTKMALKNWLYSTRSINLSSVHLINGCLLHIYIKASSTNMHIKLVCAFCTNKKLNIYTMQSQQSPVHKQEDYWTYIDVLQCAAHAYH